MTRPRLVLAALISFVAILRPAAPPSIVRADEPDEVTQLIVNLLAEKDKELRGIGLEQVRTEAKGAAATKLFAAQLPKLPPDGQAALLTALAERGDAAARPAVVELLAASREEAVRVAAIGALGALGGLADAAPLIAILGGKVPAEQAAARASLVRLRGDGVTTALAAASRTGETAVRIALLQILTTRRALDAIPTMLEIAVEDDPKTRAAAMQSLAELAGPEHLAGMVRGVLKAAAGAEREAAEKCVMLACGRIADAQRRAEPLVAAYQALSAEERPLVLPTLGRVGGVATRGIIEAEIASGDAGRHAIGLRAICNWPDASVAPRLIELSQTESTPALRAMALGALIRVAPLPDKRSPAERLELVRKVMTMCSRDEDRLTVLKRAQAVRSIDTLRYVLTYVEQPTFAQQACETIVELAHHRDLREPNKAEFDKALDLVKKVSRDPVVIDRANRYQKGQTWVRPKPPEKS